MASVCINKLLSILEDEDGAHRIIEYCVHAAHSNAQHSQFGLRAACNTYGNGFYGIQDRMLSM